MIRILALTALAGLIVACTPADTDVASSTMTETVQPVISMTDSFVMEPIAGRDMTMGGIKLNVVGGDVMLKSAVSPSFDAVELHTIEKVDGAMKMRHVPEGFAIEDGETLELKRGGNHFMMFGVGSDVVSGETVDMTLTFETSDGPMTLVAEMPVKAVGE